MDPKDITVGQIIRLVDGPLDPVKCTPGRGEGQCPLGERCALIHLWKRAKTAVEEVYDGTTFADLMNQERELERREAVDFVI
jgi:DNA-binding IscR family transcriptional regulator